MCLSVNRIVFENWRWCVRSTGLCQSLWQLLYFFFFKISRWCTMKTDWDRSRPRKTHIVQCVYGNIFGSNAHRKKKIRERTHIFNSLVSTDVKSVLLRWKQTSKHRPVLHSARKTDNKTHTERWRVRERESGKKTKTQPNLRNRTVQRLSWSKQKYPLPTANRTAPQKQPNFCKLNMTLTKAVDQTTILHGDRAK